VVILLPILDSFWEFVSVWDAWVYK
jgi:hypothetical protein